MDWENCGAIVTGGAGSLGRAIAIRLRDQGCRVVMVDRDAVALGTLTSGTGMAGMVCDLIDPAATERCINEAWDQFGPLSVLVNAVGEMYSAPLVNLAAGVNRRHDVNRWRAIIDANLTAVFLATVNAVDRMISTRTRGVVVSLSSVAASGNAGQGAYSAAKAGVNALTRAWAKELGPLGIRFVAIAPGFVDTPSTRAALAEPKLKEWIGRTPLRKLGAVDDVTSAVVFAISNQHVTGKVIEVDGGVIV